MEEGRRLVSDKMWRWVSRRKWHAPIIPQTSTTTIFVHTNMYRTIACLSCPFSYATMGRQVVGDSRTKHMLYINIYWMHFNVVESIPGLKRFLSLITCSLNWHCFNMISNLLQLPSTYILFYGFQFKLYQLNVMFVIKIAGTFYILAKELESIIPSHLPHSLLATSFDGLHHFP